MITLLCSAMALLGPAGQPQWIYLDDKGGASLEIIELTPETAARRALRRTAPGLVDDRDLRVHRPYIDQIEAAGADVRVVSRWLNAVSVEASPTEIEAIGGLPFVQRIEPVRSGIRLQPHDGADAVAPAGGDEYGPAAEQLDQINLRALHQLGLRGEGVVIGVLDTGFTLTHSAFNEAGAEIDVVASWDFVNDDADVGIEAGDPESQHEHGTAVLGVMAGNDPFFYIGGAPDASFILCKTEDTSDETPIEEDYYVAGLEFAEANGADIVTSSLGYIDWYTQDDLDGQTAVTTIAVNIAGENGVHCCTAAGNGGHDVNPMTSSLIAPADAFKVITVGGVLITGEDAGFSSDGPTADGRVKPEVLALGDQTWSVNPNNDGAYADYSGTSMATPLIASMVACLVQAHPSWTVDQIRTALMSSGDWYELFGEPDDWFVFGYGVPDALTAHAGDCNANGVADDIEIAMGDALDCNDNGVPDECDIEFASSADDDGDGVPDECAACPADFNGDGALNILDFVDFQGAFVNGDPSADCDDNGALNILDFVCFQGLFAGGC